MKVLLVNGSPHEKGCTYTALSEVAGALNGCGIETEIFWIGREPVRGCIGCGGCGRNGLCVFSDDACNALIQKMLAADGLIVGSPVYYAGPNGALCALLDRAFYASGHHMAEKPAAAVVSCRRGGASAAFDRLNKYFQMSNMVVVGSQYWNEVHGFTPDEVRKDLEGLQTMRTLARNIAWITKCIEAGRQAGIDYPTHEPVTMTNFID